MRAACVRPSGCLAATILLGIVGCAGVPPRSSTGGGGNGATSATGTGGGQGSFIGTDGPPPPIDAITITPVKCGDGSLDSGEQCDDGNKDPGDGCTPLCQIEDGWMCPTPGQKCVMANACGDGILQGSEQCDDHNTTSGDGCSAICAVELGWICRVPGKPCVAIVRRRRHHGRRAVRRQQHHRWRRLLIDLPGRGGRQLPEDRGWRAGARKVLGQRLRQRDDGRERGLRLRHRPDEVALRLLGTERSLQRRRQRLLQDLHEGADLPRHDRDGEHARLRRELRQRQRRDGRGLRRRKPDRRRRLLAHLQARGGVHVRHEDGARHAAVHAVRQHRRSAWCSP